MRAALAVVVFAAMGEVGCCERSELGPGGAHEPTKGARTAQEAKDSTAGILPMLPRCDVYHRGAFVDLGSSASDGRFDYSILRQPEIQDISRDGSTWARVLSRRMQLSIHLEEASKVFVGARIRGVSARAGTVRIDGKVVGSLRFGRDKISVVSTRTTEEEIPAGPHKLLVTFHGSRRAGAFAEVDWIRVATPDKDRSTFAAPTMRDLVIDASFGKQPRRALAMRAPATVRCAVGVGARMQLRTEVGFLGRGSGEAELRLREPEKAPLVLHRMKVENNTTGEVLIPLDSFAGKVVSLEFVAVEASGGRILFAEPALTRRGLSVASRKRARVVVIVILSGAARRHLPPYEEVPALATLTDLAAESATFQNHRATTTVVGGSMASILTGLPSSAHTVSDPAARLPARFASLATLARDGRVATGMFTGNPTTFQAFGFNRGWDRYRAISPVSGEPGRTPIAEATQWLGERLEDAREGQVLVVVHARGGHPPWAATPEEIQNLPPEEYSGPVQARRGGQVLAKMRTRRPGRQMKAKDRERIEGFISLALAAEDQALGQMIEALRKGGAWDSTLLMVTSEVAAGSPSRVPFGDGTALEEDLLELPLVVHFPEQRYAGKRIDAPSTTLDIARTALTALGLHTPEPLQGEDLYRVAAHPEHFVLRSQIALLGTSQYATRWGNLLLFGTSPRKPTLCDLQSSLGCRGEGADLFDQRPFVASSLWRMTYGHFREMEQLLHPIPSREPATIDPDTVGALKVWGNQEAR